MKDYYKILRISQFSSIDEIKKSYKELVKVYHPDKNNGLAFYHEYMKMINEAYSVLGISESKIKYDDILRNHSDILETNDIIIQQQKDHRYINNNNSKRKNHLHIFFILIFVLLTGIIIYLINKNNELNNGFSSNKNEPYSSKEEISYLYQKYKDSQDRILREHINTLNRINEEVKNKSEVDNNFQEKATMQESYKTQNGNKKSMKPSKSKKKENPCENIFVISDDNNIEVTNNNNYALQSIEFQIITGDILNQFKYQQTYYSVKPGLNIYPAFNVYRVKTLRCQDWDGNYSLPKF